MSPTDNSGMRAINTFVQPIRFRFACIDPADGRSVIIGPPSEKLLMYPKYGYFTPDDDHYVYDWALKFER